MKTRLITAGVAIPLALIVLLALPALALNIAVALLCGIAMFELVRALQIKHRGVLLVTILFGVSAPFWLLPDTTAFMPYFLPVSVILWYTVLMVCFQIISHDTLRVERTGLLYMMALLVSVALSCMAYLRGMEHGLFYVFITLIMAWVCDAGAYFAGTLFGKHKLCPAISPKKTVEGLVGGVVVEILVSLLAGWIYTLIDPQAAVRYGWLAVLALICALLSVLGDLFASIVKRKFGVKDYGNIMPGHGGVMDRFDSILLVAPFLYWAMQILPLAG